jgi:hypothetical protein
MHTHSKAPLVQALASLEDNILLLMINALAYFVSQSLMKKKMFYKIWHLVEKEKKCRYDKKNLFQNLKKKNED